MTQGKLKPDQLPGKDRTERVFVGGQYDFMPTLRAIAQFISNISTPEQTFHPIIPVDYDIGVEETMDRDLEILGRCGFAIFDLSDLGAQLVEMQEARQKHTTIASLLVYPIRGHINEPERGRRTVLSFGIPHFGYSTFAELEGIVWRFLMDAPTERDYSPRVIHDPILDREIKRARASLSHGKTTAARKVLNDLIGQPGFKVRVEPWLQLALVECRGSNMGECETALRQAKELSKDSRDEAEVLYYSAIVALLQQNPDMAKGADLLLRADKLMPGDGRILQPLGYIFWKQGDPKSAIARTRDALEDSNVPDPVVAVHAMNNLAYYLCEQMLQEQDNEANLDEALELTKHLAAYQRAFRRRDPSWLDTRGWVLTLKAKALQKSKRVREAKQAVSEAICVLSEAERIRSNDFIRQHLVEARQVEQFLESDQRRP